MTVHTAVRGTNTRKEVLEIIEAIPSITSPEVIALMPHASPMAVSSMLHKLKSTGEVTVSGKKEAGKRANGTALRYDMYVLGDGRPVPRKMKRAAPTPAGFEARIAKLEAELVKLTEWKAAAIERFPELAVPPHVIRARELVAEEVRAGGDIALADMILTGRKDTTLMMRVAIRALEEG